MGLAISASSGNISLKHDERDYQEGPSLTLDEYNSARILDCFQGSGTFGFSKTVVWKPSSRKNLS